MAGFDPELDLPTEDDVVAAELHGLDRELELLLRAPGSAFVMFSEEFHRRAHGRLPW